MAGLATLPRFTQVEASPLPVLPKVSAWHMHQPGEPVDAELRQPDAGAKHAYPVNWTGLALRALQDDEAPQVKRRVFLNMEVGRRVFDLRTPGDAVHLAHVGGVVDRLGGVYCVYGHGWMDSDIGPRRRAEIDAAAWRLYGQPRMLAVRCYGRFNKAWAAELHQRVERARRAAKAIRQGVGVALVISPWVDGQDMDLAEWWHVCTAAANIADYLDADVPTDVVAWWDGLRIVQGERVRMPYSYAEPYIDTLAAELDKAGVLEHDE